MAIRTQKFRISILIVMLLIEAQACLSPRRKVRDEGPKEVVKPPEAVQAVADNADGGENQNEDDDDDLDPLDSNSTVIIDPQLAAELNGSGGLKLTDESTVLKEVAVVAVPVVALVTAGVLASRFVRRDFNLKHPKKPVSDIGEFDRRQGGARSVRVGKYEGKNRRYEVTDRADPEHFVKNDFALAKGSLFDGYAVGRTSFGTFTRRVTLVERSNWHGAPRSLYTFADDFSESSFYVIEFQYKPALSMNYETIYLFRSGKRTANVIKAANQRKAAQKLFKTDQSPANKVTLLKAELGENIELIQSSLTKRRAQKFKDLYKTPKDATDAQKLSDRKAMDIVNRLHRGIELNPEDARVFKDAIEQYQKEMGSIDDTALKEAQQELSTVSSTMSAKEMEAIYQRSNQRARAQMAKADLASQTAENLMKSKTKSFDP